MIHFLSQSHPLSLNYSLTSNGSTLLDQTSSPPCPTCLLPPRCEEMRKKMSSRSKLRRRSTSLPKHADTLPSLPPTAALSSPGSRALPPMSRRCARASLAAPPHLTDRSGTPCGATAPWSAHPLGAYASPRPRRPPPVPFVPATDP
jgi:hypothetical protein